MDGIDAPYHALLRFLALASRPNALYRTARCPALPRGSSRLARGAVRRGKLLNRMATSMQVFSSGPGKQTGQARVAPISRL